MYASPSEDVQDRLLSMFSSTEGNSVTAFTLESQGSFSIALPSCCPLKALVILRPSIRLCYLVWIGRGSENLGNQFIGIKWYRSSKLLRLFRSLPRAGSRRLLPCG
jgi:hypothetical protein